MIIYVYSKTLRDTADAKNITSSWAEVSKSGQSRNSHRCLTRNMFWCWCRFVLGHLPDLPCCVWIAVEYIIIPGSSKCVKVVPFYPKNPPKGRIFTYLEDPGIILSSLFWDVNVFFVFFQMIKIHTLRMCKTSSRQWRMKKCCCPKKRILVLWIFACLSQNHKQWSSLRP